MFHNVVSGTVQKGIKSVACEGTSYAYKKAGKPFLVQVQHIQSKSG